MKRVIVAALGHEARQILLIEPTVKVFSAVAERQQTSLLAVVSSNQQRAKKLMGHRIDRSIEPVISVLRADPLEVPLEPAFFDAVVCCRLFSKIDVIQLLRALSRAARQDGMVLFSTPLRAGLVGTVSSTIRRAIKSSELPVASDCTRWALLAGLRTIKQALVPRSVNPVAVTWAQVRKRPWEGGVDEVVTEEEGASVLGPGELAGEV